MESTARDIARRLRSRGTWLTSQAVACAICCAARFRRTSTSRPMRGRKPCRRFFPRTYAVGAHFGVIVVLENGFQFEVATFRSDGAYLDGRRPVEVHFATAEEDAARRDFTINGMFFDPEKEEVIDFVGGRADLEARS